jgi:hypothetical protein
MKFSSKKWFFVVLILFLLMGLEVSARSYQWFKGQTHLHTTNSDGDELPRRVVRWYYDHSYNFLVITDHDHLTPIKYLDTDRNDDFILIPGEEITDSFGEKPVHINGINIKYQVEPQHGKSIVKTLQNNIDAVRKAGGIAQINHPNYKWAFSDTEMANLKNVKLVEIYNFSYGCNDFGGGGSPGMEETWDRLLSRGMVMYGIIADDTHDYEGEFRRGRSNPDRGWIMVRAKELTPGAIVQALENGDFYGTTGVLLKDVNISKNQYRIEIVQEYDFRYTTRFIGKNGKILKEDFSLNPVYKFKGDELYVRARITGSSGGFAITQPLFISRPIKTKKNRKQN